MTDLDEVRALLAAITPGDKPDDVETLADWAQAFSALVRDETASRFASAIGNYAALLRDVARAPALVASLMADVERLREALAPFVAATGAHEDGNVWVSRDRVPFDAFVRARAALEDNQ